MTKNTDQEEIRELTKSKLLERMSKDLKFLAAAPFDRFVTEDWLNFKRGWRGKNKIAMRFGCFGIKSILVFDRLCFGGRVSASIWNKPFDSCGDGG